MPGDLFECRRFCYTQKTSPGAVDTERIIGAEGKMNVEKPGAAAQRVEWQREHDEALDALRQAEDAYHRLIAGSPFLSSEDPSAAEVHREALQRLEEARRRLDEVRQAEP